MELSEELRKKMQKAVSASMQIEGKEVSQSDVRRAYIRQLMESLGVKVTIPAKPSQQKGKSC